MDKDIWLLLTVSLDGVVTREQVEEAVQEAIERFGGEINRDGNLDAMFLRNMNIATARIDYDNFETLKEVRTMFEERFASEDVMVSYCWVGSTGRNQH